MNMLMNMHRQWRIVWAGHDVAHVFVPHNDVSLTPPVSDTGKFRLDCGCKVPHPECFGSTFLHQRGNQTPSFEDAVGRTALLGGVTGAVLPHYAPDDPAAKAKYDDAADILRNYLIRTPDLQRLEGVVNARVWPDKAGNLVPDVSGDSKHMVMTVIQLFQFPNAVDMDGLNKKGPLLAIRIPLSVSCVLNSDGTALGVPK